MIMLERIRALREDKDLTQRDLGKVLQVSQSTYSDYENGKLNIPIAALKKLALFHETSIDYLLELTDNPKPYPRHKDKKVKF